MLPQRISIGPLDLSLYTALVGLGVLLALGDQTRRQWPQRTIGQILPFSFLLLGAVAILAGRAGYVAIHWAYFAEHSDEIMGLAHPGYSEHVAWLAVITLSAFWPKQGRFWVGNLGQIDPWLVLALASAIGVGASVGCIPNGCAYGREVFWQDGRDALGWLLRVDWPDELGIANPRWPTQIFMAIWLLFCLGGAFLWDRFSRRLNTQLREPSTILAAWTLLFAIGDCVVQLFRADNSLYIRNIRIEQYFDVILFILSLYRLIHSYPRNRPHT